MALNKSVRQQDGVVTNYHRILYVTITTNRQNSIAVGSYVDADSREYEKTGEFAQPYQHGSTYELTYDPSMTIEKAYDYLKTLPQFEDATDV